MGMTWRIARDTRFRPSEFSEEHKSLYNTGAYIILLTLLSSRVTYRSLCRGGRVTGLEEEGRYRLAL